MIYGGFASQLRTPSKPRSNISTTKRKLIFTSLNITTGIQNKRIENFDRKFRNNATNEFGKQIASKQFANKSNNRKKFTNPTKLKITQRVKIFVFYEIKNFGYFKITRHLLPIGPQICLIGKLNPEGGLCYANYLLSCNK